MAARVDGIHPRQCVQWEGKKPIPYSARSPADRCDDASRLRMARRPGPVMIAKADSTVTYIPVAAHTCQDTFGLRPARGGADEHGHSFCGHVANDPIGIPAFAPQGHRTALLSARCEPSARLPWRRIALATSWWGAINESKCRTACPVLDPIHWAQIRTWLQASALSQPQNCCVLSRLSSGLARIRNTSSPGARVSKMGHSPLLESGGLSSASLLPPLAPVSHSAPRWCTQHMQLWCKPLASCTMSVQRPLWSATSAEKRGRRVRHCLESNAMI